VSRFWRITPGSTRQNWPRLPAVFRGEAGSFGIWGAPPNCRELTRFTTGPSRDWLVNSESHTPERAFSGLFRACPGSGYPMRNDSTNVRDGASGASKTGRVIRCSLLVLALCASLTLLGCSANARSVLAAAKTIRPHLIRVPANKRPAVNVHQPHLMRIGAGTTLFGSLEESGGAWSASASDRVRFRFSWLRCDLRGANCHRMSRLHGQRIVVPQGARTFTIRGVVTAVSRYGRSSAVSDNLLVDEAGLAVTRSQSRRTPTLVDPLELRTWYGLHPDQDGSGQTVVVTSPGLPIDLAESVDSFSKHYGLPATCRVGGAGSQNCFPLSVVRASRGSRRLSGADPVAAVEWVHAVAPRARVIFLEFDPSQPQLLMRFIGRMGRSGKASVFSNSWCDPCRGHASYARAVDGLLAHNCDLPHGVCVFPDGDGGPPGETPANSPYALAVGGAGFTVRAGAIKGERAWPNGAGGITDTPLPAPAWERSICRQSACADRKIPDVSATSGPLPVLIANPRTGVLAWQPYFGTSLSVPLWAALLALADQDLAHGRQPPIGIREIHPILYRGELSNGLDDLPPAGWDPTSGWGSPRSGIIAALVRATVRYRHER